MNPIDANATDAEVIERSLRSPELFAVVFDRYQEAIHAYAARRAGRDAADDVLSEVFLAAFSSRDRFDSASETARPWLYGIAGNVLRRRWRTVVAADRVVRSAADEAQRAAADHVADSRRRGEAADKWNVVRGLLDGLAEGDREALLLYAWEELTYPQIAEAMGIPVGTVRSRIHRARAFLRESLDHLAAKENHS